MGRLRPPETRAACRQKNPRYGEFRPGEPHFDEFREIVVLDTAATQAAFISGQIQQVAGETP